MGMGIVNDDEFDSELSRSLPSVENKEPIPRAQIIDSPHKGRPVGSVEVPNSLRKIIGETSVSDGRQEALALAKDFGISPSSVSAYSQGATSTASYDERPNVDTINRTKEKISKRARNKLMLALSHITSERMADAKVRDVASIAKDMSGIIKNMEPDGPKTPANTGPTFVFYSPQLKKEEHFDIVQSKD